MTHVAKVDGAQMARNEITQRIQQSEQMCECFRKSYSDYSHSTVSQRTEVFFLVLAVVALLIYSPKLVHIAYQMAGQYSGSTIETIAAVSIYIVCVYITLYFVRMIVRLARIAKINGYIDSVNSIKSALNKSLASVDSVTAELENDINSNKNVILAPATNIDEELAIYKTVSDSYSNPNSKVLDGFITLAYWLSTILFCLVFVVLTANTVARDLCSTFDVDINSFIVAVYGIIALAGMITINIFLIKSMKKAGIASLVLSLFSGPLAIPVTWVLCGIITAILYVLLYVVAIAILIGIIGVFLNA